MVIISKVKGCLTTMLQIGELSRKVGVNPQTIYFYERIGLTPKPIRNGLTQDIVYLMRRRKTPVFYHSRQGLNLDEIKEILSLQEGQSLPCQEVYHRLFRKIEQIQETISQLQAFKGKLVNQLHCCEDNLSRYGSTTPYIVFKENQHETKESSVG